MYRKSSGDANRYIPQWQDCLQAVCLSHHAKNPFMTVPPAMR
jgi:hypothetical protein